LATIEVSGGAIVVSLAGGTAAVSLGITMEVSCAGGIMVVSLLGIIVVSRRVVSGVGAAMTLAFAEVSAALSTAAVFSGEGLPAQAATAAAAKRLRVKRAYGLGIVHLGGRRRTPQPARTGPDKRQRCRKWRDFAVIIVTGRMVEGSRGREVEGRGLRVEG
jgi:hypothetical protein